MTKLENIINPEVMGDMIDAKIEAQLKLTKYAHVDTSLEGVAGDSKTVPSWNYIGDAEDVAEGDEVGVSDMTASSTTFHIKKAMKCVAITEEARLSGLGNPIGQAEKQLAKAIAGKVDTDVLEASYTGTMVYAPSTMAVISYAGIVDANAKFEDEEDGIEKVLFINPLQEATLLKEPNFLSADKFVGGVAVTGAIGKVASCWVKKSKKVRHIEYVYAGDGSITIVEDETPESATAKHLGTVQPKCAKALKVGDKVNTLTSANQYYLCPILKMEADSDETEYTEDELPAITIFLKKDTSIDPEFKARAQKTEITASKYYGVAKTNDAKIVLAQFK